MKRHGLRRFYVVNEGVFGEQRSGAVDGKKIVARQGRRRGRRGAGRDVPVLAHGAARERRVRSSAGRPASTWPRS